MDDFQILLIVAGAASFVVLHLAGFLFVRRLMRRGRQEMAEEQPLPAARDRGKGSPGLRSGSSP